MEGPRSLGELSNLVGPLRRMIDGPSPFPASSFFPPFVSPFSFRLFASPLRNRRCQSWMREKGTASFFLSTAAFWRLEWMPPEYPRHGSRVFPLSITIQTLRCLFFPPWMSRHRGARARLIKIQDRTISLRAKLTFRVNRVGSTSFWTVLPFSAR